MPDGVFVPGEGGVRFEPLPPPTQAEVERLLSERGGGRPGGPERLHPLRYTVCGVDITAYEG